jgi:type IV pilus assembly protein PilE
MNCLVAKTRRLAVKGFTLIEVMITVAIVAILAAVALPAYGDYIRRGQLPEAFAGMSDLRVKMEQYYQDNRSYGTATCADASTPAWASGTPPALTYAGSQFFNFTCEVLNGGQGFRITANGVTGARAYGHTYTIDHANTRRTTQYNRSTVTASCWLTKGSEC